MIKKLFRRFSKRPSKSVNSQQFDNASAVPVCASVASSRTSDLLCNSNTDSEYNGQEFDAASVVIICDSHASSRTSDLLVNWNSDGEHAPFEALYTLRDVTDSERQSLLIRKLNSCCELFDFADPLKDVIEKETKRQTLLELVDYIPSSDGKFAENVLQDIVKMVSVNLFRGLPSPMRANEALEDLNLLDMEFKKPAVDPAWPHLQLVYEIFSSCAAHPAIDLKPAGRFIDHCFILRLLDLFESENPEERLYLTGILIHIYHRFVEYRPLISKEVNHIFYRFIFEGENHNGIADLLLMVGSIISGSYLPLMEEHKLFCFQVLIPLHKPRCMPLYHKQLLYCIKQFLKKDCEFSHAIIRGLLKYWPSTNSSKEVLLLEELAVVLEEPLYAGCQCCMVPLLHQLVRCLDSSHFQVAVRALFFLNNVNIKNLVAQNRKEILQMIFPALERNRKGHWNVGVRKLSLCFRKIFFDHDPDLLEECIQKFLQGEVKEKNIQLKCTGTRKDGEKFMRLSAIPANEGILLVDGVFPAHNHIAGIGWILLDSRPKIVHAASTPIRAASSLETEVKAILAAVSAAKQSSYQKIHVFSDCLQVVDIANRIDIGPSNVHNLFVKFWCDVDSIRFLVNHCNHDLTVGANWLASEACKTGASNWWERDFPEDVTGFVDDLFNSYSY